MPRIYLAQTLQADCELSLPESAARHIQVLRLQPDDALTLFDGSGAEYQAHISHMGKREVRVKLGDALSLQTESPLALTLVQALSAADRMDYTVQKATELGVQAIQIVLSAWCSAKLPADRVEKRIAHWQGVAIAAAEQCGRTRLPDILPPLRYVDWLAARPQADVRLLLSPIAGVSHHALPPSAKSALALIGPEGGFTPEEEQLAIDQGYTPLLLGPRIFRTETVAPVIATLLQMKYGDF